MLTIACAGTHTDIIQFTPVLTKRKCFHTKIITSSLTGRKNKYTGCPFYVLQILRVNFAKAFDDKPIMFFVY